MVNVHFKRVNVECLFTPQTGLFVSLKGIYEGQNLVSDSVTQ